MKKRGILLAGLCLFVAAAAVILIFSLNHREEEPPVVSQPEPLPVMVECTKEDYIAALAKEKFISVEKARALLEEETSSATELPAFNRVEYLRLAKDLDVADGYSLRCTAMAAAAVDSSGKVLSFLSACAPEVTLEGRYDSLSKNGKPELVCTPEAVTVYFNGEFYLNIGAALSKSAHTVFQETGPGEGGTKNYRYIADGKIFLWKSTELSGTEGE